MTKTGFVITAFQQVDLVEKNIRRIRQEYVWLKNAPIIIVTTSLKDVGFSSLVDRYSNIFLIEFKDAPGNPTNTSFRSRPNPIAYLNWRQQFLPPRILLSMQLGLKKSEDLGIETVLHLHSDTYWRIQAEGKLVAEVDELHHSGLLAIADLDSSSEQSAALNRVVPPNMHWHPEGILFNLPLCRQFEYGFTFEKIFQMDSEFEGHNYGSIEALGAVCDLVFV